MATLVVLSRTTSPAAPAIRATSPATTMMARASVTRRPPGTMIGLPEMTPWSLPEAMSEPEKVTLPMTATVAQAVEVMLKGEIGTVLLVDDDGKLAGIFSERDLLMKVAGQHDIYSATHIREFMTPDPVTVRVDATGELAFVGSRDAIIHVFACSAP